MKIFLTGGTGFIGSWVVKRLLEKGHEVTILARNSDKIPVLKRASGVKLIDGGFKNREGIENGLKGQDACVHIALGWGDTPIDMIANDTAFTVYLLEKAQNAGVEQFIYTSSTAALGEMRPLMTPDSVCRPVDLYGATKAASEAYLLGFAHKSNIRCNIIRPGYTFGNPAFEGGTTQPDRRFHKIVENALNNKPIELIKYDGTQFIHAGDLALVYLKLLESKENRSVMHGLSRNFVSWETVAKHAIELTGSKSSIVIEDKGWGADPAIFDVSFIKEKWGLDFDPTERIEEHLRYLAKVDSSRES